MISFKFPPQVAFQLYLFHWRLSVVTVSEIPIKHYTLYTVVKDVFLSKDSIQLETYKNIGTFFT